MHGQHDYSEEAVLNVKLGGKVVGILDGDALVKTGKQAVLFRNFDGFGVALRALEADKINQVRVIYENKVYEAPAKRFLEEGITFQAKGYEEQRVLPRSKFSIKDTNQTHLF